MVCKIAESFGYGSFLEGFDFPRGWASHKLKFFANDNSDLGMPFMEVDPTDGL